MRAVAFSSSTATAASPAVLTSASATGSETSARPAIASCLPAEPCCTISTRSASVSTGDSARIGSATASTSPASRTATSLGRFFARRRLFDSARRTASSTSLAMARTMSWAICKLGFGQLRVVDLARDLVRQLGADRGRGLRQQTRYVGVREGWRHGRKNGAETLRSG